MVKIKKTISIILLLSFFLSFTPNFLYNKDRGVFAAEDPCQSVSCPSDCEKKYDEKTEQCVCINCPIPCKIEAKSFENKSCLPSEGAGEWTCGTEIPIGEVIDRSSYLAGRMLAEFEGMIADGRQMADTADKILSKNEGYTTWNCQDWCQTGCYKFYHVAAGVLKAGQDPRCPTEARFVPRGIYAGDECKEDASQCKSCDQCGERCCWNEEYTPDPKKPKEVITCQYCKKDGSDPATGEPYCKEMCSPLSCMGCCGQYFWPIINGYAEMENLQKALINDIEETNSPEKFKRSYILEQLDFSRCELAQCWIPAEEYFEVLEGKKLGKHLLTCEAVSQMGLFDDDQIACLTFQIMEEAKEILKYWKEMAEKPWWQKLAFFYKAFYLTIWEIIKISGKVLWGIITEWLDYGKEEGCYPTNYYCCQM
jgi:hypothetical protein